MRCREVILKGGAKQEWKGVDAAVPSAPLLFFGFAEWVLCCMGNAVSFGLSLPIGFAKQNLRCIGRMTNLTLNGFASVVKQYLRLVKTQHSQSPCAPKTVSVSQLSLHNCPFIFLVLALCASLFPFHSPLFTFFPFYFFPFNTHPFTFLPFYFFNFQLPLFLIFYFFNFLPLISPFYFFTF